MEPFATPVRSTATRLLRVLFALGLAWAVLVVFIEELFAWMPQGPSAILEAGMVIVVVGLSASAVVGLCRQRPTFLYVSREIPLGFLLLRLLALLPLVFVTVAVLSAAIWIALVLPGEDRTNPQYGVSAVFAAIHYPIALTPVLTVLIGWLRERARSRKALRGGMPCP